MQHEVEFCEVSVVDLNSEIEAIESGLLEAGVTLTKFCFLAKISVSTWTRWRSGVVAPNFSTWSRVEATYEDILFRNRKAQHDRRSLPLKRKGARWLRTPSRPSSCFSIS